MYNRFTTYFPAPGKGAELRGVLEEQVQDRVKRGLRASLSTTVIGDDLGAHHLAVQYDDLTRFQSSRGELAASIMDWQARQAPLIRKPNEALVLEVLLPRQRPASPGSFRWRVTLQAATGKAAELRRLLTQWANDNQAQGIDISLLMVVGGTFGTFVQNRPFESIAEFERWRSEAPNDSAQQGFLRKRDALLAAPTNGALIEFVSGAGPSSQR